MRSITFKLILSFMLVIIVGVGLVAFAANQGARGEFATYLERGPTIMRLERAVAALTSYYVQNGRWDGSQALLESLASSQGGRFVLTNGNGTVLADSNKEMVGRVISETDLGDASAVFMNNKQVGAIHFVPVQYGGHWWDVLGQADQQSRTPEAVPTQGWGGMMGGMMGSGRADHMSPGTMGQMMGSWESPRSVVGPPEQAYLSGFNDSLWLGGLGAAIVALALGLISARRITRPLRRLAEASTRIAGGDLSQRVKVSSRDELGELASSFNSMAEALARNEETRRHMVTDIAHELRTPLTVLQGNLEGMLDGVVPLSKETVVTLHQETQLLSRLVSDLRELSLAESGQLQLHRAPTDMGALVQQATGKMWPQAQAKGVRLDVRTPDGLPSIEVDPDRISQVLANLLSNALRHTPADGAVAVTLERVNEESGSCLRVSVADSGPGIPAADLPFVFDRFYRADRSRSRSTGGSGLGLTIVKQLVEAHGGRVWASMSQASQGATFYFTVPY